MDEIFGRDNFISTVIWEKTTSARNDASHVSVDHDYIIVFAKQKELLSLNGLPRTEASEAAYRNPDDDPRGPWREGDYKGAKSAEERPNLYYPIVHPRTGEEVWPRRERVWAYGREEHQRHVAENLLWWGKTGNYRYPKLKRFREHAPSTLVPRTLWKASDVGQSRRAAQELRALFPGVITFATPKPESLLKRIIEIGSDPGDTVLDCFLGSATTAAVAHKLGRRWIGIERELATLEDFAEPRLQLVVDGADPGGITSDARWSGGGGFRVLEVAPSMYEESVGRTVLSDWATNGRLTEAVAAQYAFSFEPDPPFAGRKGRSRLAVVDGLVDEHVVDVLLPNLGPDETLLLCGTALDPDVVGYMQNARPGSRVERIPDAMLTGYQREFRRIRRWERDRG
jgi:adenine-specific DNA-methyltransferase